MRIFTQSLRNPCLYASLTHCESMRKEHTQNLRIFTQNLKIRKFAISCCAFYDNFKAKSQRAIRLHSCESIFIIFAPLYVNSSRQNRFKCCNLHYLIYFFLDNGVMTTPKRWILSFVFTVQCLKKSLLIQT